MTPLTVAASEFREHFSKYLSLVEVQDIEVTRNGKVVGLWTNPKRNRLDLVERLAGSIHAVIDLEEDLEEKRGAQ